MNKQLQTQKQSFKEVISSYATSKVVDWVLKNGVDQGATSSFKWSQEDKVLLKEILFDPKISPSELPIDDQKFKIFFQSVIDNGLNSDDVRLFERYKNKLPLRALGLAYDLTDFKKNTKGFISNNKIEAGYYMLEITISPSIYSSKLPVSLNVSDNESVDLYSFHLLSQSEKMTKRLIKFDENSYLTIANETDWNFKNIKHFRLAKLTRNFFLSRMYKKLGKAFDINQVTSLTSFQIDSMWAQYDRIFNRGLADDFDNYHQAISNYEKLTIPSAKYQMQRALKWLSK